MAWLKGKSFSALQRREVLGYPANAELMTWRAIATMPG
jgi:hypothetical protein